MGIPSKADGNVPFLPGRKRYSLVGTSPAWIYHRMAAATAMTGVAPRTALLDEAHTDPVVSPGKSELTVLTFGGLFTHIAKGRALVVEAIDNPAAATITIVSGAASRTAPAAPFKVGANETLKAVTVAVAASVGFLVRLDGEKVW